MEDFAEKIFAQINYKSRVEFQTKTVQSWMDDESFLTDRYLKRLQEITTRIQSIEKNYTTDLQKLQVYLLEKISHLNDRITNRGPTPKSFIISNDEQFISAFYTKIHTMIFNILSTKSSNSAFLDKNVLSVPGQLLTLYSSTKRTFDFLLKDGPLTDLSNFRQNFNIDVQDTKSKARNLKNTSEVDLETFNLELKSKKDYWNKKMYSLHVNSDHNLITLANHYASFRVTKQNLQLGMLGGLGRFWQVEKIDPSQFEAGAGAILPFKLELDQEIKILTDKLLINQSGSGGNTPMKDQKSLRLNSAVGSEKFQGNPEIIESNIQAGWVSGDKESVSAEKNIYLESIRYRSVLNTTQYQFLEKGGQGFRPEYIDWLDNTLDLVPKYFNYNARLEVSSSNGPVDYQTMFMDVGKLLIVLGYGFQEKIWAQQGKKSILGAPDQTWTSEGFTKKIISTIKTFDVPLIQNFRQVFDQNINLLATEGTVSFSPQTVSEKKKFFTSNSLFSCRSQNSDRKIE